MEAFREFAQQMRSALDISLNTLRLAEEAERLSLVGQIRDLEKASRAKDKQIEVCIEEQTKLSRRCTSLADELEERNQSTLLLVALVNDRETAKTIKGKHKIGQERRQELEAHLKAERQRLFGTRNGTPLARKEIPEIAGEEESRASP